jgi:transposase
MRIATTDIRPFVVRAYESGVASRKQLAEIFGCHINSIGRWIRECRATKRLSPLPRGHRALAFSQGELYVEENPDATLKEIREHFQKSCSLATISKMAANLGYAFKKNLAGKRARPGRYPKEPGRAAGVSRTGSRAKVAKHEGQDG